MKRLKLNNVMSKVCFYTLLVFVFTSCGGSGDTLHIDGKIVKINGKYYRAKCWSDQGSYRFEELIIDSDTLYFN